MIQGNGAFEFRSEKIEAPQEYLDELRRVAEATDGMSKLVDSYFSESVLKDLGPSFRQKFIHFLTRLGKGGVQAGKASVHYQPRGLLGADFILKQNGQETCFGCRSHIRHPQISVDGGRNLVEVDGWGDFAVVKIKVLDGKKIVKKSSNGLVYIDEENGSSETVSEGAKLTGKKLMENVDGVAGDPSDSSTRVPETSKEGAITFDKAREVLSQMTSALKTMNQIIRDGISDAMRPK